MGDIEDWADWTVSDAKGQLKPFQYPKWWQVIKKSRMRKAHRKLLERLGVK